MNAPQQQPYRSKLLSLGADHDNVDALVPSPNIGQRRGGKRPRFLIIHYTGLESATRSIEVLSDPICQVSCHYVVDVDGRITQMVREDDRAWHAGQAYWQGETDINSCSVGIEIQNPGHAYGMPAFPEAQMLAVQHLAGDIVQRHAMRREHVLAHSDVAPQRKIDPGEKFDWQRLHLAGIGHWVRPHDMHDRGCETAIDPCAADERVLKCQALLDRYGYDVAQDGVLSNQTQRVISAFQRHFRQSCVNGVPDHSTINTLRDLIAGLEDAQSPHATPT